MANDNGAAPPITIRDLLLAARQLSPHVRRTPTVRAAALSAALGQEIWLKLESQQATGSFKLRGALNCLLNLSPAAKVAGVLTCSAGNHGLGVAAAAQITGVAATIVVPRTASPAKITALRQTGVDLLLCGDDYDAAEAQAPLLAHERGLTFISPYNDPAVIAGAGTVALEALSDLPEVGTIVVPVGGGGLAAGVGIAARTLLPTARLLGVQAAASAAMASSFAAGKQVNVTSTPTLADGLAGNIAPNAITFPLVRDQFDAVLTVSEAAIRTAIYSFLDAQHLVVEGSGAVGLAALQAGLLSNTSGPTLLIVSGSNISTETIAAILAHH